MVEGTRRIPALNREGKLRFWSPHGALYGFAISALLWFGLVIGLRHLI